MCSQDHSQTLLDHSEYPRNTGELEGSIEPFSFIENRKCGDSLKCRLELVDGKVKAIQIDPQGCAVSKASASIMSEAVKGLSLHQVAERLKQIEAVLSGSQKEQILNGDLLAFASLKRFPMRHRCVTLSWDLVHSILEKLK